MSSLKQIRVKLQNWMFGLIKKEYRHCKEEIMAATKKTKTRSKRSRQLDRARVSLTQKHEVDYIRRIARAYLNEYKKVHGGAAVTVRWSSLRRFCKFIIKATK